LIRRRYRSLAAWLALFAMLLSSITPVISQSLAATHGNTSLVAEAQYCGQAPNAEMGLGGVPALMLDEDDTSSSSGQTAWHDACGYCTLASACPMVLVVCASVLAMAQAPTLPVPSADDAVPPSAAVYPHALTRAPPVLA